MRNSDKIVRQWQYHQLNPIPAGEYDAIFLCDELVRDDMMDSDHLWHTVHVTFSPEAHQMYHLSKGEMIPSAFKVTLNGTILKDKSQEPIPMNDCEPLIFRMSGDEHYPSFEHTVPTDSSIKFLSPNDGDSISLSHGFEVKYRAPKDIDTVLIHMTYFGKSVLKSDTSGKIQNMGQSYYYLVPNTGSYIIPHYTMFHYFKSFDPEKLFVEMSWTKGDTLHVGTRLYGFIATSREPRFFKLKP
ncbi:MAG TPA: hypothetical protein VGM92_11775 [Candidatus Kapabacteria bacterium]